LQRVFVVGLLMTLGWQPLSGGSQTQSTAAPEIGIVERLGDTIPLGEEVYDEQGNLQSLRSLISKPTILTFVYYRCPGICSPLLTELARMVDKMDLQPGKDYQIITISFDYREKPELAAEKQENYLSAISRPVDPSAWHFLTADSAVIQRLTRGAGFYFKASGNDWIHAGALIFLSRDGKITSYMYGMPHLPYDIKMAVIEASEGKTGPTIAKVLRFCYVYDPVGRTYALNVTRIALVATLLFAGVFALVFIVRPRKKQVEDAHGKSS